MEAGARRAVPAGILSGRISLPLAGDVLIGDDKDNALDGGPGGNKNLY